MNHVKRLGKLLDSTIISKAEFEKQRDELAHSYVGKLCKILSCCQFQQSDHCLVCDQLCQIIPTLDSGTLWLEVAGTTCCPWTGMNSSERGNWVDSATLPCLVWAFSTKQFGAHLIVHECTPRFRQEDLAGFLNSNPDGRRCEDSEDMDMPELFQDAYDMFTVIFSPYQLGIPTVSLRRYTWFCRRSKLSVPLSESAIATLFEQVLFGSVSPMQGST